MRLFLLPISTRRSLLYCERLRETATSTTPGAKAPLTERITNKASETWLAWEKKESGWQRTVTNWGNALLARLPYEEYGLKSLPPLTKARTEALDNKKLELRCEYPAAFVKKGEVLNVLGKLATERQGLHRQRLLWCLIGMPVSAPFMIVPIVPNLPFYYLVYRAYCHYRAWYGGKTLEYAISKGLVEAKPSKVMDEMYVAGLLHSTSDASKAAIPPSTEDVEKVQADVESAHKEVMLLKKHNSGIFAEALIPELQVEIERAVDQVQNAITKAEAAESSTKDKAS